MKEHLVQHPPGVSGGGVLGGTSVLSKPHWTRTESGTKVRFSVDLMALVQVGLDGGTVDSHSPLVHTYTAPPFLLGSASRHELRGFAPPHPPTMMLCLGAR